MHFSHPPGTLRSNPDRLFFPLRKGTLWEWPCSTEGQSRPPASLHRASSSKAPKSKNHNCQKNHLKNSPATNLTCKWNNYSGFCIVSCSPYPELPLNSVFFFLWICISSRHKIKTKFHAKLDFQLPSFHLSFVFLMWICQREEETGHSQHAHSLNLSV